MPFSSTPAIVLISRSVCAAFATSGICASNIQPWLSVIKPSRHLGFAPIQASFRATKPRAIGTTSTGTGILRPKTATRLLSSIMHTNRLAECATTFSRKCAPPPPLISCRLSSASSAPSIYKSKAPASVVHLKPAASNRLAVSSELGETLAIRERTCGSKSIRQCTVVPLPTPSRAPSLMKSSAALAAIFFNSAFTTGNYTPCRRDTMRL